METKSLDSRTVFKIGYRSCLEYLEIELVAGLSFQRNELTKALRRMNTLSILLYLLGAWKLAFDKSEKTIGFMLFWKSL